MTVNINQYTKQALSFKMLLNCENFFVYSNKNCLNLVTKFSVKFTKKIKFIIIKPLSLLTASVVKLFALLPRLLIMVVNIISKTEHHPKLITISLRVNRALKNNIFIHTICNQYTFFYFLPEIEIEIFYSSIKLILGIGV